jgi:hypothetical protein
MNCTCLSRNNCSELLAGSEDDIFAVRIGLQGSWTNERLDKRRPLLDLEGGRPEIPDLGAVQIWGGWRQGVLGTPIPGSAGSVRKVHEEAFSHSHLLWPFIHLVSSHQQQLN